MATVYRFEVECVSAFCAYPQKVIEDMVRSKLEEFIDPITGLKLESITITAKGEA